MLWVLLLLGQKLTAVNGWCWVVGIPGLATITIFFCFLFVDLPGGLNQRPLVGETLLSSVPASISLVFILDP